MSASINLIREILTAGAGLVLRASNGRFATLATATERKGRESPSAARAKGPARRSPALGGDFGRPGSVSGFLDEARTSVNTNPRNLKRRFLSLDLRFWLSLSSYLLHGSSGFHSTFLGA